MEENVRKKTGTVYSAIVFLIIFSAVYLFWPQISMVLPFFGESLTVRTGYSACSARQMIAKADVIVLASVTEKGKPAGTVTGRPERPLDVTAPLTLQTEAVLFGLCPETLSLVEEGGSVLAETGGRAKKFNVKYEDAASFKKGKTYLLFLDAQGRLLNGRFGALQQNEAGSFTDGVGDTFGLPTLKTIIGEVKA